MTQENLEQRTILYDVRVLDKSEIKRAKKEEGEIKSAFFGRVPVPNFRDGPIGLNVSVETCGQATSTFTKMDDIITLMDSYGAKKPEELQGKKIYAYIVGGSQIQIALEPYTQ